MSESDQTQAAMRSLRERIDVLEHERGTLLDQARFAAVTAGLGIAIIVLSAMSWAISPDGTTTLTLWDLSGEDGWQGTATLLTILALGTWTVTATLAARPSPLSLGVPITLSIAVIVLILMVGAVYPTDHSSYGHPAEYHSDPARWLTMATALTLTVVNTTRLGRPRDIHS